MVHAFGRHFEPTLDIFDFFLHTTPLVVLAIRLWRDAQRRRQGKQ